MKNAISDKVLHPFRDRAVEAMFIAIDGARNQAGHLPDCYKEQLRLLACRRAYGINDHRTREAQGYLRLAQERCCDGQPKSEPDYWPLRCREPNRHQRRRGLSGTLVRPQVK